MSALLQRLPPARKQAARRILRLSLAAVFFSALAACQTPAPAPEPEVSPQAPIVKPEPLPEKPAVKPPPPPPPPPPPVAVLLSRDIPAYTAVSAALEARLMETADSPTAPMIVDLETTDSNDLLDLLGESKVRQVVAIGDRALDAVEGLTELDVIYAQVFTPQHKHRGVPAIPPAKAQLTYWRKIDNDLQRVGVLGSEPFRAAIEGIAAAGSELGMVVQRSIVSNDKQAWLEFRRLLPEMDGFIILPDQSILSPGVIQKILSHGRKNNVRFLTYNALLFKLGAHLHVTQNPEDVASQIADLLKNEELRERPLTVFRARTQGSEVFVDVNS